MVPEKFDLIVIGTGPAGYPIAVQCREAGLKVAAADEEFGGTCAIKGCTPKKVLATAAEILHHAHHLKSTGIASPPASLDWASLVNFKRSFTDLVSYNTKNSLREQDIAFFKGKACFVGRHEVQVGNTTLRADKIVIATGARPVDLPIEGKEYLYTSEDFMESDTLPPEIIFVGGGYVAFELAHIAAMAGAKVTILEKDNVPLKNFDTALVAQLMKSLEQQGIDIKMGAEIQKIQKRERKYVVTAKKEANISINLEASMIINAAGRVPAIADLDLKKADVAHDDKGVMVNEYLQSITNACIYAAGDAADTPAPFTPVANDDGSVVAHNIIYGNERRFDHRNMPTVLFTSPKLASVGLSEREAVQKKLDVTVNEGDSSTWLISKSLGEKTSAYKILIDKQSGQIVGAHILHPKADEMINFLALAVHTRIKAEDIKHILLAFPTATKEIQSML